MNVLTTSPLWPVIVILIALVGLYIIYHLLTNLLGSTSQRASRRRAAAISQATNVHCFQVHNPSIAREPIIYATIYPKAFTPALIRLQTQNHAVTWHEIDLPRDFRGRHWALPSWWSWNNDNLLGGNLPNLERLTGDGTNAAPLVPILKDLGPPALAFLARCTPAIPGLSGADYRTLFRAELAAEELIAKVYPENVQRRASDLALHELANFKPHPDTVGGTNFRLKSDAGWLTLAQDKVERELLDQAVWLQPEN